MISFIDKNGHEYIAHQVSKTKPFELKSKRNEKATVVYSHSCVFISKNKDLFYCLEPMNSIVEQVSQESFWSQILKKLSKLFS